MKKPLPKIVKFGCLPLAILFVLLIIIGLLIPTPPAAVKKEKPADSSFVTGTAIEKADTIDTAVKNPVVKEPDPEPVQSSWRYSESTDRMDNVTTYWAINTSPEELYFQFPYDGGSTVDLQVRKKGGHLDIYFIVSKGQFQTYNQAARLKFDNEAPIKVYLNDASDGSTEYAFISNPASILGRIKKSKTLLAELPFYDEGRRQVSFDIQNLDWKH